MSIIAFLMTIIIYGIIIPAKILIVLLGMVLEVLGGAIVALCSTLAALIRFFRRK